MNPRHDLPSGRELEEAWRRVERALHGTRGRRRPPRRTTAPEELTCSPA